MPPPEVPAIEPILTTSTRASDAAAEAAASSAGSGEAAVRRATLEDIDRIDELTLDDFDLDLSNVLLPEAPPVSA